MRFPARLSRPMLAAFLCWTLAAAGRVYLPGTGKSAAAKSAAAAVLAELPGIGEALYTAEVTVNELPLQLVCRRSTATWEELLAVVKRAGKRGPVAVAEDAVRLELPRADGQVARLLIIPGKVITVFEITGPAELPAPGKWPDELPALPLGATPTQVIRFAATGAVYGAFVNAQAEPEFRLHRDAAALTAAGWRAAGMVKGPGGSELFLHPWTQRTLLVSHGARGCGAYFLQAK